MIKNRMDYASDIDSAREAGIAQGKLEIARKMKVRGRPLAEIIEDTGLSADIIEKL